MRYLLSVITRRIVQLIPVLLGITLLAFCLVNFLPGNVAVAILGENATNQQIAQLTHQLGLDQPFWYRFGEYLWGLLHANLGNSLSTHQPVISLIAQRLPVSVELIIMAYTLSLGIAIPVAILTARRPNGVIDKTTRTVSSFLLSVPHFVTALLLILIVAVKLNLLPPEGFVSISQGFVANIKSMLLPSIVASFPLFATYTRVLRADIIDQMENEDYILTARSKGIRKWRILCLHAAKNSLFSLITIAGANFGYLIGGQVVIESIFGLPGLGELLQTSISNRDYTVVQGETILIAIAVVTMNLVTDLGYLFLDPRVRYGATGN